MGLHYFKGWSTGQETFIEKKKILNGKLNFQLRKSVFLINDCCFPQYILILCLAFSGQKQRPGHNASLQFIRYRRKELSIVCTLFPAVTGALCPPVFCMSGLCEQPLLPSTSCSQGLLGGSISHLEIYGEHKIEFFTKRRYFSANYKNKSCEALWHLKRRPCQFCSFPRLRKSVWENERPGTKSCGNRHPSKLRFNQLTAFPVSRNASTYEVSSSQSISSPQRSKRVKENTPPRCAMVHNSPACSTSVTCGWGDVATSTTRERQRQTIIIPDTPSPAVSVITISSDTDEEEEQKHAPTRWAAALLFSLLMRKRDREEL